MGAYSPTEGGYNGQQDKQNANEWGSVFRRVGKALDPRDYYQAVKDYLGKQDGNGLLPRGDQFVGPPQSGGPSDLVKALAVGNQGMEFQPPAPQSQQGPGAFPGRQSDKDLTYDSWKPYLPGAETGDPETVDVAGKPQGGSGGRVDPKGGSGGPRGRSPTSNPLAGEEDSLKEYKDLIKKFENRKMDVDLNPLLALSDSWTGGHLQKGYEKPMTDDERDKIAIGMKQHLAQQESSLKYKQTYLKAMADQNSARRDIAQDKLDSMERIAAGHDAARSRGRAVDPGKAEGKLFKDNKGLLEQVAFNYGDGYDPKDRKSTRYKGYAKKWHDKAMTVAENAVDDGQAPDVATGYQMAVSALVADSTRSHSAMAQKQAAGE